MTRRALSVALLQEEVREPQPEQRAIAVAVLGVIRKLSEAGPVLLAVDDVQWLDTASQSVLEFVLRRLRDERVGVLFAWRIEGPTSLPLGLERGLAGRLRRMRVGALGLGAVHEVVLADLGVAFDRPILRRIHETSGGNPSSRWSSRARFNGARGRSSRPRGFRCRMSCTRSSAPG